MSFNKLIHVNTTRQLIDLNGNKINFELNFSVKSLNKDIPIYVIVVSQNTLDTNENLEYKKVFDTITGSILSNEGIYQSYYLILRSDEPVDCEVKVEIIDVPQIQHEKENKEIEEPTSIMKSETQPSSNIDWKKILLIVGIIIVCVGLYFFFYKKNSKTIDSNLISDGGIEPSILDNQILDTNNIITNPLQESITESVTEIISTPVEIPTILPKNDLLSKINDLVVW